ncbi:MAG TPA: oxygenase MpaB family protein [Acidimicrobiales bacterium]|nr:oxygenase MpaB family protein [Acidimicrobiales bacterium]
MPDAFPKGSVIRRVNSEPAIMLGAGRALLLQLAHPAVAQGVRDHSEFERNPFKRLQGTLEATYAAVFGSDDLAAGVGRRIQWIHEFVTGPGYRANDPENLLWVHATLVDTALECYTRFVGPLSGADEATYYEEMTRVAGRFGLARAEQPADIDEFRRYVAATIARIDVTDAGRDLASFILRPTLPLALHVPFAPVLALERLLTLGLTPPAIRRQLDVSWEGSQERRFVRAQQVLRAVFAATPRPVRIAPTVAQGPFLLSLAGRHVRSFEERQRLVAG